MKISALPIVIHLEAKYCESLGEKNWMIMAENEKRFRGLSLEEK